MTLALVALGFFLFDLGYHFARPVPTYLSSAQDVTQLAGQAVATLVLLVLVACGVHKGRAVRAAENAHDGAPDNNLAEVFVGRGNVGLGLDGLALLAIICAALFAVAEALILSAPSGAGLVPAYVGTALSGLGFGACFVAWTTLFARCAHGAPSMGVPACLALLAALAASRGADTLVRHAFANDLWLPVGMGALDVSLVFLVALTVASCCKHHRVSGGAAPQGAATSAVPAALTSAAPSRGRIATGLIGAALFSALFGLMTQMHNVSQGLSTVPDSVSCLVTLLLFVPLAIYVVREQARVRLGGLFLVSLPVAAAILIAVALLQNEVLGVADALIKTLFNVYFAATLVWVVPQADARPALVPGALLAVWTGVLVGSAAGFAAASLTDFGASVVTALALSATWICTFATALAARNGALASQRAEARGGLGSADDMREGATTSAAGEGAEVRYVDRVADQVSALAHEYGLSPREQEVVLLLAQGRSAARIADGLVVSESTVKTHLQNAYAKVGVHSKQDLLDKLS